MNASAYRSVAHSRDSAPSALILVPDISAIKAWVGHDRIVAEARAKTRLRSAGSRRVQTALGELVIKMHQNRIFDGLVLTDTILSELFGATLDGDREILLRQYGAQFEMQFGRGHLTWLDIKHALLFNPQQLAVLPDSNPPVPLIPRKDIEQILLSDYQSAESGFRFLQANLAFIDFAQTLVIESAMKHRGERSIADYIKQRHAVATFGSPERLVYKNQLRMPIAAPTTYVVVTENIEAFEIFVDTGEDLFVMNNYALVHALCEAKIAFGGKVPSGNSNAVLADSIPVPEPKPDQSVQKATNSLFRSLSSHMRIPTMKECHEAHHPLFPKNRKTFDVFMVRNLHMRRAAV